MSTDPRPPITFIRKLCEHLAEPELQEAERRFWQYLELVRDIVLKRELQKDLDGLNSDLPP